MRREQASYCIVAVIRFAITNGPSKNTPLCWQGLPTHEYRLSLNTPILDDQYILEHATRGQISVALTSSLSHHSVDAPDLLICDL